MLKQLIVLQKVEGEKVLSVNRLGDNSFQIPNSDNSSQAVVRLILKRLQPVPCKKSDNSSQILKRDNSSQIPKSDNSSQIPKSDNSSQIPKDDNSSQAVVRPILEKTTTSPMCKKRQFVPNSKARQFVPSRLIDQQINNLLKN